MRQRRSVDPEWSGRRLGPGLSGTETPSETKGGQWQQYGAEEDEDVHLGERASAPFGHEATRPHPHDEEHEEDAHAGGVPAGDRHVPGLSAVLLEHDGGLVVGRVGRQLLCAAPLPARSKGRGHGELDCVHLGREALGDGDGHVGTDALVGGADDLRGMGWLASAALE
jgi:hypothetical protein